LEKDINIIKVASMANCHWRSTNAILESTPKIMQREVPSTLRFLGVLHKKHILEIFLVYINHIYIKVCYYSKLQM